VRAANNNELGPATPDILVSVTGGCQTPAAPTDLTAIVRTIPGRSLAWIQWNPGSGGVATFFNVIASLTPGGPPLVTFQTNNGLLNGDAVPTGTFYVRVQAVNGRGQSATSNEVTVVAPSNNLQARTPDPVNGARLPMPYVFPIVQQVIAEDPSLLSL